MVAIDKLKGKMAEKRFSLEDLANEMKINRITLSRKIKNAGSKFTISEVTAMINALGLTTEEINFIFFCTQCRINATMEILTNISDTRLSDAQAKDVSNRVLLHSIINFYDDPKNQEKFLEWLKNRKSTNENGLCNKNK